MMKWFFSRKTNEADQLKERLNHEISAYQRRKTQPEYLQLSFSEKELALQKEEIEYMQRRLDYLNQKESNETAKKQVWITLIGLVITTLVSFVAFYSSLGDSMIFSSLVDTFRSDIRPYIGLDPQNQEPIILNTSTGTIVLTFRIVNFGKVPGYFDVPLNQISVAPFDLSSSTFSEKSIKSGVMMPGQWRDIRIEISGVKEDYVSQSSLDEYKQVLENTKVSVVYSGLGEPRDSMQYFSEIGIKAFFQADKYSFDLIPYSIDAN